MKAILTICLAIWSFSVFSFSNCPQAVQDDQASFCASFKSVAACHCMAQGLPQGMCQNMQVLYERMVSIFFSLENACRYQKDTTFQTCIDDWNCYRFGGRDSLGRLCSGSGSACS